MATGLLSLGCRTPNLLESPDLYGMQLGDNGISTRYQGGFMSFPQQDVYWSNTLAFIKSHMHPEDVLLVPTEFTEKLIRAFDYSHSYHPQEKRFQWLVIHK